MYYQNSPYFYPQQYQSQTIQPQMARSVVYQSNVSLRQAQPQMTTSFMQYSQQQQPQFLQNSIHRQQPQNYQQLQQNSQIVQIQSQPYLQKQQIVQPVKRQLGDLRQSLIRERQKPEQRSTSEIRQRRNVRQDWMDDLVNERTSYQEQRAQSALRQRQNLYKRNPYAKEEKNGFVEWLLS